MELPRRGVKSELQLPAYSTATAMPDLSCICSLCHSLQQCLILNPLSEARGQTCVLMDTTRVLDLLSSSGNSFFFFFFFLLVGFEQEAGGHSGDMEMPSLFGGHSSFPLSFNTRPGVGVGPVKLRTIPGPLPSRPNTHAYSWRHPRPRTPPHTWLLK